MTMRRLIIEVTFPGGNVACFDLVTYLLMSADALEGTRARLRLGTEH
jgi:hypothetical protein